MKRCAAVAAVICFLAGVPAGATVRYRISLAHPEGHFFQVTMTIPRAGSGMEVALPAWNALYQIRDFAYRVQDVRATWTLENGVVVQWQVTKLTKDTWKLTDPGDTATGASPREVRVQYRIFWDDPGPFDSQVNAHHAFVNFAEVLMYLPQHRGEDVRVDFADVPSAWKATAELRAGGGENSFSAISYDALVDAPAEIGTFEEAHFTENGARYRMVIDGNNEERAALLDGLRRIAGYETTLMRGAPFDEYLFLFHIGPYDEAGGGGMEHANCTAIGASSANGALRIAAHEFFHLWNVKRIRPVSLQPVDYSQEQWTRALWFAEGVTSTYCSYTLLRSGIWSRTAFYDDLAGQIADLESRPARRWKSVEEASLDAWLETYEFYGRPDTSISYYNKGQIVGDMLDLTIRNATDNHASLDDVMRRMNTEYAQKGKFYDDSEGVRGVAEEVAGRSLADFFARYVSGTTEIPYNEFLGPAGLQLHTTQEENADLGFDVGRGPDGRSVVAAVASGGLAADAGLATGDGLVSINGEAFPRYISRWMREHLRPGETVRLVVERNGMQKAVQYSAGTDTQQHDELVEIPNATARQVRIREGWLKGTTN